MIPSLCELPPHMITSKFSPNLYAPPSRINMTTMIKKYTKFPPTGCPSQT